MNSYINLIFLPEKFYGNFDKPVVAEKYEGLYETAMYMTSKIKKSNGDVIDIFTEDFELYDFLNSYDPLIKIDNKFIKQFNKEIGLNVTAKTTFKGVDAQVFSETSTVMVVKASDFYNKMLKEYKPSPEDEETQTELLNLFNNHFGENNIKSGSYVYLRDAGKLSPTKFKILNDTLKESITKRAKGCIVASNDIYPIWIYNLYRYTNKTIIDSDKYKALNKLISTDAESKKMAISIIDNCNLTDSVINMLLLHNKIAYSKDIKKQLSNTCKVLPPIVRNVDQIIHEAEGILGRILKNEELIYIADNYYNPRNETSDVFKFNLKLK